MNIKRQNEQTILTPSNKKNVIANKKDKTVFGGEVHLGLHDDIENWHEIPRPQISEEELFEINERKSLVKQKNSLSLWKRIIKFLGNLFKAKK
jgi:hypothetical protein